MRGAKIKGIAGESILALESFGIEWPRMSRC